MTRRLEGKRVLITGAASGIGRASALKLARDGAAVALLDWDDHGADELVAACAESRAKARFWTCDVSDEEAVRSMVAEASDWLGGLDVVAHVAGIVRARDVPVEDVERADWDEVISVNLTGALHVVKYTLGYLERSRGAVILTGSGAGVFNRSRSVPYTASKGGLQGLAIALEEPLRDRGVRVNNLAPGAVDTPLTRRPRDDGAATKAPGRQLVSADSVAAIVAFLASDDAADVRGIVRTW